MKVLKSEVRTIYRIEFTFKEMADAKEAWVENKNLEKTRFPKAFDNEDFTMGVLKEEFSGFNNHGDFSGYMANYLGFDGWENAGFYVKDKKVRTMSVYKYGDAMN